MEQTGTGRRVRRAWLLALLLDAQVDFRARAFTSIEEARTWLCETQAVGENHVVPAGS